MLSFQCFDDTRKCWKCCNTLQGKVVLPFIWLSSGEMKLKRSNRKGDDEGERHCGKTLGTRMSHAVNPISHSIKSVSVFVLWCLQYSGPQSLGRGLVQLRGKGRTLTRVWKKLMLKFRQFHPCYILIKRPVSAMWCDSKKKDDNLEKKVVQGALESILRKGKRWYDDTKD